MPHLLKPPQVEVEAGSLYSNEFQDCYFQASAPIDEINHVFIQGNDIIQLWDECHTRGQNICLIGETGFGTGLNFIVTWALWQNWCLENPSSRLQLHFVSVEFAPLNQQDLLRLYEGFPQYKQFIDQLIDAWPPSWQGCHYRKFIDDRITLSLLFGDGVDMLVDHEFKVDAWYLDGFAPSRNQRMWSPELYTQLALHSKPNTRLATFTAAGHVRRGLGEAGFIVKKLPGFNKRHMSIARFRPDLLSEEPDSAQKRIAIIGAGYAGIQLAHCLQGSDFKIDLFDQAEPMSGASGNFAHLLYLKPRKMQNEFNTFFEQAYSYAVPQYEKQAGVIKSGCLHFIDPRDSWSQESLADVWPEDWVRLVSSDEASQLAGINIHQPCLWMPKANIIQPGKWAKSILKSLNNVNFYSDHRLIKCKFDKGWFLEFADSSNVFNEDSTSNSMSLSTRKYDYVVWAGGAGNIELMLQHGNVCIGPHSEKPSHWRYPLRPIAGQSSLLNINHTPLTWPCSSLKTALSGSVYITPAIDGYQSLGSRFYPDQFSGTLNNDDHFANIQDLSDSLNTSVDPEKIMPAIVGGTSATRVQSSDYLPIVGEIFQEIGPGLMVLSGFGAKGTITAPFTAQILANYLNPGAPVASHSIIQMLNPDRFKARLQRFAPKLSRPRSWK